MKIGHGMAALWAETLFGAVSGVAVGLIAGPIGAAVGAGLGAIVGMTAYGCVRWAAREEAQRQRRMDALTRKLELPLQPAE